MINPEETYTVTFKLTRNVEQDWCSAVDNGLHEGRTSREALKAQLALALNDCIERGFLAGEAEVEIVSAYGKIDWLDVNDAYEDAACAVGGE